MIKYAMRLLLMVVVMLFFTTCGKKRVERSSERKDTIAIDVTLPARIDSSMQKMHPLHKTAVYVYDLTADKPIYGFQEKEPMPTASCMKLLTGIAAQHLLTQRFTFNTEMYADGRLKDGTFYGTIALKDGLDPQLSAPDLLEFAKRLRKQGVKVIKGRLLADLLLPNAIQAEEHWFPWDLEKSRHGLFFQGGDYVLRQIKRQFRAAGIAVPDSCVQLGRVSKGMKRVFRYKRPLRLIVERMWKNSSNTQSIGLLCAIGNRYNPQEHPAQAGVAYLRKFMADEIHADSTFTIHDGCGLCTHNRLSPEHLVALLRYGYRHEPIYRWLNRLLPLSGVDGTLRYELTHASTRGKVRAKTGTLSHPYGISTLSGFCPGKNGHMLAFSIMNSEMSVLDAHVIQRKLCQTFVK